MVILFKRKLCNCYNIINYHRTYEHRIIRFIIIYGPSPVALPPPNTTTITPDLSAHRHETLDVHIPLLDC